MSNMETCLGGKVAELQGSMHLEKGGDDGTAWGANSWVVQPKTGCTRSMMQVTAMAIWQDLGRATLCLEPLLTLTRHLARKKQVMNTHDQISLDCLKIVCT